LLRPAALIDSHLRLSHFAYAIAWIDEQPSIGAAYRPHGLAAHATKIRAGRCVSIANSQRPFSRGLKNRELRMSGAVVSPIPREKLALAELADF